MLRLLDAIAERILRMHMITQMRLGVALTLLSIPFYVYMPFSGEPPVVYFLSAMALTLTGITIIFAAQPDDSKKD